MIHPITQLVILLMYLRCFECITAASSPQITTARSANSYKRTVGPVQLNASVSSDVITMISVQLVSMCLLICSEAGCLIASWSSSSNVCQLVTVNNASQVPGPPGSHVRRLVGSEADATVWKVDNFDELVKLRQFNSSTLAEFKNSSTGRNGSIQQSLINVTGCYSIQVAGARGGRRTSVAVFGGSGSLISGLFVLTSGTQLSVVVGQKGSDAAGGTYAGGGGGGGSLVYGTMNGTLLIAAGGGGGSSCCHSGEHGEAGRNGSGPSPTGFGGINGQPGYNNPNATQADCNHGGCGAGWSGKAVNPRRNSSDGDRGGSLADGWVGGQAGDGNTGIGGFGGGGGGGATAAAGGAGGAGGGFSGGGAGVGLYDAGGGGGSFCSGRGCTATTGGNVGSDHGFVVLKLLVPFADSCS